MAGCCRRASAFASWRNRAIMPGVHAISGCRTLQARRRSRSTSHSSYASANPPRPTSFFTWYLAPSARASRSAVACGTGAGAPAVAGLDAARSLEMTVGEGLPQVGQKAEPVGISARQRGQLSWVVTAPKIRRRARKGNRRIRFPRMLLTRLAAGVALAYVVLVLLGWWFQDRLAFPAPRRAVPDPRLLGIANGERIEVVMNDGTRLAGWYLGPTPPDRPQTPRPALLWFYGNGENIASFWPVVRECQPPGAALLVLDYPGYGGSGGRATERALYAAADAAYDALATRPGVDPQRIYVYGRSLGSAVATYTAAHRPVSGLILESPFTNAAAMAKYHYGLLPRFLLRLSLDNVANVRRVSCPILLFHGDADRLVPTAMGMAVAAAAAGPVEVVLIHGAGHNDTYDVGGRSYRDKMWRFIGRTGP